VVVADVHPAAQKALSGRRLADYLADELRGQLLRRDVAMIVHDDVARGLAQKIFHVVPRRFAGERLDLPSEVNVAGFVPMRVELYLARGAERPAIQVACSGTLVADDIAQLEALGLALAPWIGRELVGLIDFAGFHVPPGTRRGVMPDEAAAAFAGAMDALAPAVEAELARMDHERKAAVDRDVVRDLRRALRGFQRRLPRYELPRVGTSQGEREQAAEPGALPLEPAKDGGPGEPPAADPMPLFPVGSLAEVAIVPSIVRVAPAGERAVRAVARDANGRAISEATFAWSVLNVAGAHVTVRGDGDRLAVCASPDEAIGASATLVVEASDGDRTARGEAHVEIGEDARDQASLGVPEPHLVSDAEGAWRSRMAGERWEVNDAHEDYRALRAEGKSRLRYLLLLLAKEIVLRTTGRVETADVMDSMVEVLAHAERNLRGG
jgi:hypothetical protein